MRKEKPLKKRKEYIFEEDTISKLNSVELTGCSAHVKKSKNCLNLKTYVLHGYTFWAWWLCICNRYSFFMCFPERKGLIEILEFFLHGWVDFLV